ncbi:MAG: hypothetical protein JWM77_400 [Rhodospirillales bacterium]|nr:hypothetical protein [Rhodospirillales bacterium]
MTLRLFQAAALSVALLGWAQIANAAERSIAGQYEVQGRGIGQKQPYKGTATVERIGATYKVTWQIGRDRYVGTGLRDGDAFAVVYGSVGQSLPPGMVLYRIQADGSLLGTYTQLGAGTTAPEAWLPGRGN